MNLISNASYLFPPLLAAAVSFGLAALVWYSARRSSGGQLFCGFLITITLWSLLIFGMRSSADVNRALLWDRPLPAVGYLAYLLFYHFTAVYTGARGQRGILASAYTLMVIFVALSPTDLLIQQMRVEDYGYAPVAGPVFLPISLAGFLIVGGAVYNLVKHYCASHSDVEKNRLLYLMVAMLFPMSGALLDSFTNLPPASIWSNLLFCIICTTTIMKYNLLDIRVIIRKSLAYILVSALVAVPYVGILVLLVHIFKRTIEPWWAHAIIILLLAILLRPLYSWAQHLVDRLFYRDRYDYLKALEQFSQKAQSIGNLKELSSTLTQLISGALHTSSTCLLLPSESDSGWIVISCTRLGSPPSGLVLRNNSLLIKWLKLQHRILSSEEFNIIPQLQSLSLRERNNLEQMGAKLCVPIQAGPGKLSGILVLGQKFSEQPYSSEDKQLLTSLSSQMAIALENARLYSESQREIMERMRTEEVLREYQRAVEGSEELIAVMDQEYTYRIVNEAFLRYNRLNRDQVVGHTAVEILGEEVFTKTVKPNVDRCLGGETVEYEMQRTYPGLGERYLNVRYYPLKNSDKETVGVVAIIEDITEHKRMEEELEQSHEQLRNLSAHIESLREAERTSIAREIHDELGQALTALKMDLSWLNKRLPKEQETLIKKTGEISGLIDTTIQTVKRISTELRPGVLDDLGLIAAIEWQVQEFQERTRIKCELTTESEDINLDRNLATGVFRILQEALTNVARHANATRVEVSLKERAGQLVLEVRDNGKGITETQIAHPKSFGLIGMRERARSWNGSVKIHGILGKGTTITVSIPLNREEERDDKNTSR